MQIVREPTGHSTTRLHQIMQQYAPPMRRVCPHLSDDALRSMIERMAQHRLEEELALLQQVRASYLATPRSRRSRAARPAMTLAS